MEFTRGDTYKIKFQRRDLNNEVITTKAQKMWLTVKKNWKTSTNLIQKTLAAGTISFSADDYYYHVVFNPSDTKSLKYKTYVFDIQVENNGEVTTIYKGNIKLLNEATFEGGAE